MEKKIKLGNPDVKTGKYLIDKMGTATQTYFQNKYGFKWEEEMQKKIKGLESIRGHNNEND